MSNGYFNYDLGFKNELYLFLLCKYLSPFGMNSLSIWASKSSFGFEN
jgi:hypothetical protein